MCLITYSIRTQNKECAIYGTPCSEGLGCIDCSTATCNELLLSKAITENHVGNQSDYDMLAYHSMITTSMASNKEGKSMLNSAYVIYLIYSNEECMLPIMGYIGRGTAALSRTYPASYTGASCLDSGSF